MIYLIDFLKGFYVLGKELRCVAIRRSRRQGYPSAATCFLCNNKIWVKIQIQIQICVEIQREFVHKYDSTQL